MSPNIVAIAGITGKMGKRIAFSLLDNHPELKIHGIARSPDKVHGAIRNSASVTLFKASAFDTAAIRGALKGVSVCICCYLGDQELMLAGQKALIDACIDEGVARYVASDWSLDYRGLKFGQHPLKDPMKHVQAYLQEKEAGGKIKGVHVLNGGFMEILLGPLGRSLDAKRHTYRYWGTGDEKFDVTTYGDAAAFTAEVAADQDAVGFLNVVGDRISAVQLAETYEEVYGEPLLMGKLGSLEDLKTVMLATLKEHPNEPFKWMGMCYMYYMLNGATTLGPVDTARYPNFQPASMELFLRQNTREELGTLGKF